MRKDKSGNIFHVVIAELFLNLKSNESIAKSKLKQLQPTDLDQETRFELVIYKFLYGSKVFNHTSVLYTVILT